MYQVITHYENDADFCGTGKDCIKYVVDVLLPKAFEDEVAKKQHVSKGWEVDNLEELYDQEEHVAWDIAPETCGANIIEVKLPKKMYGLYYDDHHDVAFSAWSRGECLVWYINKYLVEDQKHWGEYNHLDDFGVKSMEELRKKCLDDGSFQSLEDYMEEGNNPCRVIEIASPK